MHIDAPPNSLKDPKVGVKVKTTKNKRVRACSLICNILGVGRCVGAPRWD